MKLSISFADRTWAAVSGLGKDDLYLGLAQLLFSATSGVFVLAVALTTSPGSESILLAWNVGLICQIAITAFLAEPYVLATSERSTEILSGVLGTTVLASLGAGAAAYAQAGVGNALSLILAVGVCFSSCATVARLIALRNGLTRLVALSDLVWLLACCGGAALGTGLGRAELCVLGWTLGAALSVFVQLRPVWQLESAHHLVLRQIGFRLNVFLDTGLGAASPWLIVMVASHVLTDRYAESLILFWSLTGPTNIAVSALRLRLVRESSLHRMTWEAVSRSALLASSAALINGAVILLAAVALRFSEVVPAGEDFRLDYLVWPIAVGFTIRKAAGSGESQFLAMLVMSNHARFVGRWRLITVGVSLGGSAAIGLLFGAETFTWALGGVSVASCAVVGREAWQALPIRGSVL